MKCELCGHAGTPTQVNKVDSAGFSMCVLPSDCNRRQRLSGSALVSDPDPAQRHRGGDSMKIPKTNGTPQHPSVIQRLADQAQAENESGVVAGDTEVQAYLEGVETALRWAIGAGTTEEIDLLISRANQVGRRVRLILTDDDGTMLDSVELTRAEFDAEVKHSPTSVLSELQPGSETE